MASPAVTDRALRYRAQKNAPDGPKVCCYCGSTRNVEVDHVDGHEENFEPENLAWSCRSCNTAKANTMRAAGIGRLTRQYNPGSKGAHTVGEWMQAVGAITPHKGRKYAGYNYGLVSDMPVHEAVSIIRATPPARRAKFASQLRRHNPPDLNESVQDRSYREWTEHFQHVSASPEDASERDLRRAIGYLDHARRWYIRRMQADGRPVDPNVLAGYDNEAEYFLRLSQRPEAKRRNPAPEIGGPPLRRDYNRMNLIAEQIDAINQKLARTSSPAEVARLMKRRAQLSAKASQWDRGSSENPEEWISKEEATERARAIAKTIPGSKLERAAHSIQVRTSAGKLAVAYQHGTRHRDEDPTLWHRTIPAGNPVTDDLKQTGRAALKQYDRLTDTTGKVLGTVLDLPRKWAGAIVGEKGNPRPAEVPRNYEVVSIRDQAQDAQDVKDALERNGIPAIIVTQRHTSIGTPIGSPYSVWTPKKTYRRAVRLAEQAYFARHPERLQPNPSAYPYWVESDGQRQYFADIKAANQAAQKVANETGRPAKRHDLQGGHSVFYPKRNPDKFDRCVRDVQARGGPVNAYAVCTAAGTRNPAPPTLDELRATVTLAGYTPGVSYDDNQLIYAASQESTGPGTYGHPAFEAIYHKETGWLTVGDTHTFVPNPRGKTRFEECVESVTAAGTADDPRAVCAAAGRKKYGQAEMTRRAIAGRKHRGNPSNPHEQAAAMYESFHGKPPENEILVQEEFHVHEHLAPLGVLVNYKVATITGLNATIESSDAKTDYDEAAADPNSIFVATNEQGTQLYFVGGDQSLDLKRLEFPDELVKDDMIIGTLYELTYRTRKKFDKFKLTDYYHGLGEDTGEQPLLRYDPLSPHQYVSGGAYKIEQPLIGMSPGIEN